MNTNDVNGRHANRPALITERVLSGRVAFALADGGSDNKKTHTHNQTRNIFSL